jgi:hypothetical protein
MYVIESRPRRVVYAAEIANRPWMMQLTYSGKEKQEGDEDEEETWV